MARSNVKRVQEYLNKKGIKVKVDGWFGDKCENAVYTLGGNKENLMNVISGEPKTAHFCLEELKCKDGTRVPEKFWGDVFELMNKLEELRCELSKVYGGKRAIYINSGYRTPAYNSRVGGVKNSQHLYAKAADIRAQGLTPKQVYKVADKIFADGGVGIYNTFVHVDVRNGKARWDKR